MEKAEKGLLLANNLVPCNFPISKILVYYFDDCIRVHLSMKPWVTEPIHVHGL